jgi:hypothetical protein
MAQIALNKPSGGQLILAPEDGTSSETITIPARGVDGKLVNQYVTKSSTYTHGTSAGTWVDVYSVTYPNAKAGNRLIVQHSTSILMEHAADVLVSAWLPNGAADQGRVTMQSSGNGGWRTPATTGMFEYIVPYDGDQLIQFKLFSTTSSHWYVNYPSSQQAASFVSFTEVAA